MVFSFLTEAVNPERDLSEVLLDLDLTEDLLELFGVLVETSLVSFLDLISLCSDYHERKEKCQVSDLEE